MRPLRSFSRLCDACYSNKERCMAAQRHASSRSKVEVEVAREEHAENVRWSKEPEARAVLEQPRFDVDGATAEDGALYSLDAYLQVRFVLCREKLASLHPFTSCCCIPTYRNLNFNFRTLVLLGSCIPERSESTRAHLSLSLSPINPTLHTLAIYCDPYRDPPSLPLAWSCLPSRVSYPPPLYYGT